MVDGHARGVRVTGPSYHARTHLPGGTDPITGLSPVIARAYTNTSGGDAAITVGSLAQVYSSFAHTATTDSSTISWSTTLNTNDTVHMNVDGTYMLFGSTDWNVVGSGELGGQIMVAGGGGALMPHNWVIPTTLAAVFDTGNPNSLNFALFNGNGTARFLLENNSGSSRNVIKSYLVVIYLPTGLL